MKGRVATRGRLSDLRPDACQKYAEIQFKRREFIILQRGSLMLAKTRGMEKGREEVARNLLDILDDETIAAKIGLSVTQINLLQLADTRWLG
jgi:hypothetical protein